ncbi:MAG: hypothetical protein JRI56_11040 [Deltaproteobacteria bacterium]|nr:hypothetical protein [Deltaproteobacteria bacterium]
MGSQRESLSFCGRQFTFTGEELVKRAFAKYHAALAFSRTHLTPWEALQSMSIRV